jgi:hypothetical protein
MGKNPMEIGICCLKPVKQLTKYRSTVICSVGVYAKCLDCRAQDGLIALGTYPTESVGNHNAIREHVCIMD